MVQRHAVVRSGVIHIFRNIIFKPECKCADKFKIYHAYGYIRAPDNLCSERRWAMKLNEDNSFIYTVECPYNEVQYNKMLYTSLQWWGQNINQRLNLRNTQNISPGELWCAFEIFFEKSDRVITAPRCIYLYTRISVFIIHCWIPSTDDKSWLTTIYLCIAINWFEKKTDQRKNLHYWPIVKGVCRWQMDSSHNWPETRKAFPCHKVHHDVLFIGYSTSKRHFLLRVSA